MDPLTFAEILSVANMIIQAIVAMFAMLAYNYLTDKDKKAWKWFVIVMCMIIIRRLAYVYSKASSYNTVLIEQQVLPILISLGLLIYIIVKCKGIIYIERKK